MINSNKEVATVSGGLRDKQKKKQEKNKAKNETKRSVPTFGLPYDQIWPTIPKLHVEMVREEIQRRFSEIFCDQWLLQKKRKLQKNQKINKEQVETILLELMMKSGKYAERDRQNIIRGLDERVSCFTDHLVVGVNEVSRSLEKNNQQLSLVVVCRSAKPTVMTQHILCQCLLGDVPTCSIDHLSGTLAPILNLKSVLAIGFKAGKDNMLFDSLVEFVKDKIPQTTNDEWIRLWKPALNNISAGNEAGQLKRKRETQTDELFHSLNIVWKEQRPKKKKRMKTK